MDVKIRPVQASDAADLHRMRCMRGVFENTLGIGSARLADTEKFLDSIGGNDHVLVAETEGRVVGVAGLHVQGNPRMNHCAVIGLNVDTAFQNQGIGSRLMEALLEIADDWLMLVRVELTVFTDNLRAVHLYQRLGFEVEGTKKYACRRHGVYADEYMMARYRHLPENNQ